MIYGKYNALVSGAHLAKHLYLHIFAIRKPIKASRLRAQILPPMTKKMEIQILQILQILQQQSYLLV